MKEKYVRPSADIIQFQSATPLAADGSEHDNGYVDWFGLDDHDDEAAQLKQDTPPGF